MIYKNKRLYFPKQNFTLCCGGRSKMQFKLWASELLSRLQYYAFRQRHSVISMH